MNKKIIGIDLGTTNTVACVWNQFTKTAIPITNSEGDKSTPSVVSYTPEGILVGQNAINAMSKYTQETAYIFKKLIGKKFKDVKNLNVSYKIVSHENGDAMIDLGNNKIVSPIELSSKVLQKMKVDAESQLGYKIDGAVVTVPAFFNDDQRQATKLAIELAGLECVRVINEPTAACLYYGLNKTKTSTVAVYDFGGGTFDMSILNVEDGLIEVLSTYGDTSLGGSDLDKEIMKFAIDSFNQANNMDLLKDGKDSDGNECSSIIKYRILEAAEKATKDLSSN
jgi:molecular chaperone DnaK